MERLGKGWRERFAQARGRPHCAGGPKTTKRFKHTPHHHREQIRALESVDNCLFMHDLLEALVAAGQVRLTRPAKDTNSLRGRLLSPLAQHKHSYYSSLGGLLDISNFSSLSFKQSLAARFMETNTCPCLSVVWRL